MKIKCAVYIQTLILPKSVYTNQGYQRHDLFNKLPMLKIVLLVPILHRMIIMHCHLRDNGWPLNWMQKSTLVFSFCYEG